jgi:hypothetical protein
MHPVRFDSLGGVEAWLRELFFNEAPPSYRLGMLARVDGYPRQFAPGHSATINVDPRSDSGTFEVRIGEGFMQDDHQQVDFEEMAAQIDDRLFTRVEVSAPSVLREAHTVIREAGIDVIGPGGRVIVYHQPIPVAADLVVRRRVATVGGRWRSPVAVLRDGRLPELPRGTQLGAHFGYFELSMYERQELLRPVIFLSVDFVGDGPTMRRTFAVAATDSDEIGPVEGLGEWASP